MAEVDELFTIKNNYWLGNYQDAIAEAKSVRLRPDPAVRVERDVYVYRSLIGLRNFKAVLDDIRDEPATPAPLRAVRYLAAYYSGQREAAVASIDAALADAHLAADHTLQAAAAYVYISEGNHGAAAKVLRAPEGMEQLALAAGLYLRMDRPDLADRALAAMRAMDDEHALFTITAAQAHMAAGGDRIKEAAALYRELNARFGGSVAGVNGLAAVYIAQKRLSDAERLLNELLEGTPGQPDALVNLVAVYTHMGRADAAERALDALRAAAPGHPYLASSDALDAGFDRVAAGFAVSA